MAEKETNPLEDLEHLSDHELLVTVLERLEKIEKHLGVPAEDNLTESEANVPDPEKIRQILDSLREKGIIGQPEVVNIPPGATTNKDNWMVDCTAPNGITSTLWSRSSGGLEMDLETPDRTWDQKIVALGIGKRTKGGVLGASSLKDPQVLLVPLSWSERTQSCVAELDLGRMDRQFDLLVISAPIQEVSLSELENPGMDDALHTSVKKTASERGMRAWESLVQKGLPQGPNQAITKGLRDSGREAPVK